jgi:hypothetical protein
MRRAQLAILAAATGLAFLAALVWNPDAVARRLGRTVERRLDQAARTVTHRAGMAYELDVSALGIADRADNSGGPAGERIEFLVNGVPLRRSPSHAEIERAPGLFSHWGNVVIFSPPDGGSPRGNDEYLIRYRSLSGWSRSFAEKSAYCVLIALALLAGFTAFAFSRAARGRLGGPSPALPLTAQTAGLRRTTGTSLIRLPAPAARGRSWRVILSGRWGLAACAVFVLISVPLALVGRADRSGWTLMTRGVNDHQGNSHLGYCCFRGSTPVMEENEHSDRLIGYFSGVNGLEGQLTCYAYRGGYSFLGSLLAPALGVVGAMAVVNWLAWALAAWAAYRLTVRLHGDPLAGLLAVVFVAGGIGVLVHAGDYSAHLLAFAVFYAVIDLIHGSGVLTKARPLRTHLLLGAALAAAALVYTNGPILIAIYALSALRRNRWAFIAAAVLLAVSARPAWEQVLAWQGVDVPNDEGRLLGEGLSLWRHAFADPVVGLGEAGRHFLDFVSYECPLTSLFGVAAWLALGRRREDRYFGALVLLLPVLAVMPFAMVANARGYLVYGSSIWLFAWLSGLLAGWLRKPSRARPALACAAALVVLAHFGWSTAHLWGHLGPVKTYYEGASFGWSYFRHLPSQTLSLTGREGAPIVAGGTASLREAGAVICPATTPIDHVRVSAAAAFSRRALFFVYLALLAGLLAHRLGLSARGSAALAAAVLALAPISAAASAATLRSLPAYYHFKHEGIRLPPGAALTYRVRLGAAVRDRLARAGDPADDFGFFLHHLGDLRVTVRAGDCPIPVRYAPNSCWAPVDAAAARAALLREGELTVEAANDSAEDVIVSGWQRPGLPDRELSFSGPAAVVRGLPTLELRAYRADGTEVWAGL